MPHRFVLPSLILLAQTAFAQSNHAAVRPATRVIDSLNTEDQVLAFVQRVHQSVSFHPDKPLYAMRGYEKKVRDFGARRYEKADFDNNGYTDLLFNGYDEQNEFSLPLVLVIFTFNRDSLWIEHLPEEIFYDFFAAKTVRIDGQTCLHTLQISHTERRSDTLVWFQNCFIEKVPPVTHSIEKIRYQHEGGLAPIGALRLTIFGDSVKLEKVADASPRKTIDYGGIFVSRLDTGSRHRLYALLQHLDFPHLKDHYQTRSTDPSYDFLEITYDQGKKKIINDYGAAGTYGLSALQSMLLELQNTQRWVKTDAAPSLMPEEPDNQPLPSNTP